MFTSPQALTINAVSNDLHKVTEADTSSLYKSDDETLEFQISHQKTTKRARRMARLDQTKIAADPLTAINSYQKAGVYIVIDEPQFGYTNTEIEYLVESLKAWLTSANITAMLGSRH